MADDLRASYDEAPYESYAHPQSSPGHLAALAWVFGLESPEVSTARVLEIGCASAGNLIPFAAAHPGARAVGIDLSPVQVERGRLRIRELGLCNIALASGDVSRLDFAALGQFDYIICHGVYSWVSSGVQEAILAACRHALAPLGIAYVSYNVYPGWKAKEIVRDAMLLSAGESANPAEKVRFARDIVGFLQRVAEPDSVLARALADYQSMTAQTGDYYLLHEELEAFNNPCYFRDMAARARSHGLEYLAEAQPEFMFAQNYGPVACDRLLRGYGDNRLLLEQHLDFVVNRMFRQTLFVHAGREPQIRQRLDPSRFHRLHFASWTPPIAGKTRLDASNQPYGHGGMTFGSNDPAVKAAVDTFNTRWPWTLSRRQLLTAVRTRLSTAGVDHHDDLTGRIDSLLEILIVQGHARIRLDAVTPAAVGSPIRLASAVRRMARLTRDDEDAFVFNTWHEMVSLSPVDRHLIPLLDGRHDCKALLDEALEIFRQNVIRIEQDGLPVVDESAARKVLAEEVDSLPRRLADLKLLDLDRYPPSARSLRTAG